MTVAWIYLFNLILSLKWTCLLAASVDSSGHSRPIDQRDVVWNKVGIAILKVKWLAGIPGFMEVIIVEIEKANNFGIMHTFL